MFAKLFNVRLESLHLEDMKRLESTYLMSIWGNSEGKFIYVGGDLKLNHSPIQPGAVIHDWPDTFHRDAFVDKTAELSHTIHMQNIKLQIQLYKYTASSRQRS